MNALEHAALLAETDGAQPRFSVRSKTRVDAGRWWRRTPLWVCVMEHEIVLLAVARRRYVKRIAFDDCGSSHYCHTTGDLVIAAGEELMFSRFAMSPTDGLRILQALGVVSSEP